MSDAPSEQREENDVPPLPATRRPPHYVDHLSGTPTTILIQQLDHQDAAERVHAVLELGRRGHVEGARTAQALIRSAADVDTTVREWAVWALGEVAPSGEGVVEALHNALADVSPRVRAGAAIQLERQGPNPARLSTYIDALADESETVRRTLTRLIAKLAPSSPRAIRALAALLDSEDATVRQIATRGLSELGRAAFPQVAEQLEHASSKGRSICARLVAELDKDAAAEVLLQALHVERDAARMDVLRAIAKLGSRAAPARTAIAGYLKDPEPGVREQAIHALAAAATDQHAPAEPLAARLSDPESTVRRAAALALGKVASELGNRSALRSAVLPLALALEDADGEVQTFAAWALEKLGPIAIAAIPALENALDAEQLLLRRSAAWALESIRG